MSSVRRNWLARLTNKCSADEDLEYYVREVADIVGLIGEGGERGGVRQRYVDDGGEGNTKAILSVVFRKVRNTPERGRPRVVFFHPPPPLMEIVLANLYTYPGRALP